MRKTLDIHNLVDPDSKATEIAKMWDEWNGYRKGWMDEKREIRNYVFATDTRTTSNSKLPWSNSTTMPKLCQIYDNLNANYTAALFPNSRWMSWKAVDRESNTLAKRTIIQDYMEAKVRQTQFQNTVDRLLDDFVLTGNCFATVDYEYDATDYDDGSFSVHYAGPTLVRISPYDIVFDPTAASFHKTPKIVRTLKKIGEVKAMVEDGETQYKAVFDRIMTNRGEVGSASQYDKADGFIADGFGSIDNYYNSSYVELLTFYGDLYDSFNDKLHKNRIITIVDRAYVIDDVENPSWLGGTPIFHAGWRSRPDNLWAMGPLDNLVGLQYRIDHLENLRADVFDQIALPMLKIRGDVEDFDYEPGGRVYIGEEGDVAPLVPDSTALNADLQIRELERKMEEMAGAPRMAMGIRTPGEKTAFEVQTLDNAANRIFNHKASKFEQEFLEPALNAMLEAGRRNLSSYDTIQTVGPNGVEIFQEITREDINGNGKIIPMGARHFQERAHRVQTLTQLMQVKQDPSVAPHISGIEIARILSEELDEPAIFGENIAIKEQGETQTAMMDAQANVEEDLENKAELGY